MIANNNPLNVRFNRINKWRGMDGQNKGFCTFTTMEYGIRAAAYLLLVRYPQNGYHTIAELIGRFAPPIENHTDGYIRYVCGEMGADPSDTIESFDDAVNLILAMARFETGSIFSREYIEDILVLYFYFNAVTIPHFSAQ